MKRSASDFAAEARKDEPYELTLEDGTVVQPRSTHDFSHDEYVEEEANRVRWYAWHNENEGKQAGPDTEYDGVKILGPDEWNFRARFGDQYEAWWAEWRHHPRGWLTKLLIEIDTYYDPSTGSANEKAALASGDADAAGKSGGAGT